MSDNKTFELDGTRPVENSDLEVTDTFEEDGTRPIAESPDYLVRNTQDSPAEKNTSDRHSSAGDEEKIAGKEQNPVDTNSKVVDTFEADGTRPIMANKYEVVDTLDVDGERPITSE